ncbi:MAG: hypothetical protein FWE32_08795 [Oscillospiraceae bacterium]|nr:hypothetical protein [Oscillospiraceae bacterium]
MSAAMITVGYKVAYSVSVKGKVDYISLHGTLDRAELNALSQIGACDRIQVDEIPTQETLIALNEQYYSQFPTTGFRFYGNRSNSVDFKFLRHLPNLEKLSVEYKQSEADLSVLKYLKNLKTLELSIGQIKDFCFLSETSDKLERFALDTKKKSFDLSILSRFKQLKVLELFGLKNNIESILALPLLEDLLLSGITLTDLSFLNGMRNLKALKIHRGNTSDFSVLYGNTSIVALNLFRVTNFTDIDLIAKLPNLVSVELRELQHIQRFTDLSNHESLKHIHVDGMKSLLDLSALECAKSLESVSFVCCPPKFEPNCILPVLKNSTIKQCSFYTASEKKNKQIGKYIKESGKANKSNAVTVRDMLYSNRNGL